MRGSQTHQSARASAPHPSPSPQGGEGDRAAADETKIMFMASSGGLKSADLFQGRDAVLSGPAGGVVGMAETARLAGFGSVIGFDMGGTSTDVSHFAGDYERSFETEVAGVRMRVPMLRINTVAAGGGSILFFDGARFRVGPQSAGADPGPKCYRRGGPLTVTDANVMVGKLSPGYFPAIFGADGNEPLDETTVRSRIRRPRQTDRRRPHRRGSGRRLHPHRRREHGQRHQENLRRARLRRHRVRAQLLRLRRRPARLPDRRHARHGDRAHPSAVRPALRLRHRPRPDPRQPRAVRRSAAERCRTRQPQRPARAAQGDRLRRSRNPGHRPRRHLRHRLGAPALREHRHRAAHPPLQRQGHARNLRDHPPPALRLRLPRKAHDHCGAGG